MLAIYKKEMHAYFTSLIGWLFLALFLLGVGLFHWFLNLIPGNGDFSYALGNVSFFFIFIIPMFTMRIMAEEGRQKTDQLLYTSPVSIVKIVIGKFLAMISVFSIGLAVVSLYPLGLTKYGSINLRMEYISILGFFLMVCAYMAIGMFISSLTESQILAAVITILTFAASYFINSIASVLPTGNLGVVVVLSVIWLVVAVISYVMMKKLPVSVGIFALGEIVLFAIYFIKPTLYDGLLVNIFSYLCLTDFYGDFANGVLDFKNVIYYISVTAMFLFFTVQVINKKRWS